MEDEGGKDEGVPQSPDLATLKEVKLKAAALKDAIIARKVRVRGRPAREHGGDVEAVAQHRGERRVRSRLPAPGLVCL